jgi:aspartyl-tRNA(Asn)/glutamyl-tRNA(Gln) amidotransferase subunit A
LFTFSSIPEYQQALFSGTLSCREAVAYYLERIRRLDHLTAFIRIYAEEAIATADRLDRERLEGFPAGKLHGVVIGIKDVICYKGHPVTASSHILE